MGGVEVGTWKLLLYPIALILFLGIFANMLISPLVEEGVTVETQDNQMVQITSTMITDGVPFDVNILGFNLLSLINPFWYFIPTVLKEFIANQILIFLYLPSWMQGIVAGVFILCSISIAYSLYVLLTMLPIPFT